MCHNRTSTSVGSTSAAQINSAFWCHDHQIFVLSTVWFPVMLSIQQLGEVMSLEAALRIMPSVSSVFVQVAEIQNIAPLCLLQRMSQKTHH